jgi:hypothetical protein
LEDFSNAISHAQDLDLQHAFVNLLSFRMLQPACANHVAYRQVNHAA